MFGEEEFVDDIEVYEGEGSDCDSFCDSDSCDDEGLAALTSRRRSIAEGQRKSKIKCHLCSRFYKNVVTYRKHLGKHALQDLLEHNRPSIVAHRQFCRTVHEEIPRGFLTLQPESSMTTELKECAGLLLSMPLDTVTVFVDLLADLLWEGLPAPAMLDVDQLHCAICRNVNLIITSSENRASLEEVLRSDLVGLTCSDQALMWFVTDFCRKLAVKSEVFFIRSLREPYEGQCPGLHRDDTEDINFQQSVHYVGGSVVKSVMRKAQKGLGTKAWSDIYDCLLKKFVVGEGMDGPGERVEAWTNTMERGGLQCINEKVWSFLIALSCILKKEEGDDGSILHKNVSEKVTADDVVMFLWNDITENSLPEDVDVLLLQNFCEFFTNAWLKGVILRRKNAIPHVSRDKAALRARVTR